MQRFGGGLNLNVHVHTLALNGVFVRSAAGPLECHSALPPSDAEVGQVLAMIRRRVDRLLRRRSLDPGEDGGGPEDRLAEAAPALASIVGASVQGRAALGTRAGAQVRRLGEEPRQGGRVTGGPRHAHLEGFDLHADVWVPANNRARLEQLCRYVLRPPLAEDRLRLLADGCVRVTLKRAWRDGTTYLLFEPVEFLEKVAALTPRPEINLALYPGCWPRTRAGGPASSPTAGSTVTRRRIGTNQRRAGAGTPGRGPAPLLDVGRADAPGFGLEVLRCPRCAGRMQLMATIDDPAVIQRILAHLGLRPPVLWREPSSRPCLT